jgi:CarD family transcriptional regulator
MPAKKLQKKVTAKKAIKKPAPKAVKKAAVKKPLPKKKVAKVVKKPVKKLPAKKAKVVVKAKAVKTKKPVKKPAPKPAKKPVKKVVKAVKKEKKSAKIVPVKATKKPSKASKKLPPKKELTPQETAKQRTALAKSIMANTNKKVVEEAKAPEKKTDALQKIIIARKYEGRGKVTFKVGDYAVYPSHGIGKITGIEKTAVLGQDFSCYLMYFEKEKLTIKIPMNSAEKIGLRHLISKSQMDEVFVILRSGVKKLKGMWSRRAQEYETKINSGDIMLLAEVLRDLTRDIEDGERSYSERIIYETAIYRLANEYSVIYGIEFEEAKEKVTLTAKDKLNSEGRIIQKDGFDDFDADIVKSDLDEDEDEEEEESEDEDEDEEGDDDYDDDDDDKPKKGRRR